MTSPHDVMNRRGLISLAAAAGLAAYAPRVIAQDRGGKPGIREADVSASEDLMREHGVLRRTLLVYANLFIRLRRNVPVDPAPLADAAKLFREFGEDYHERLLEEPIVFPAVRRAGGALEKLVDTLLEQHRRGREITDYLQRVAAAGRVREEAEPLARALAWMTRMYDAHTAWEDTVLFPAWKKTQSEGQLAEFGEKFEQIEHRQFGGDGFDLALERVARIEQAYGLADLGFYTAPPSPRAP